MKIKSVICLTLSILMLTALPGGAIKQEYDSKRYIGVDGWVDSFEDESLYPLNDTIPRTTLTNQSNAGYENKFMIVEDPKGQNGHCMMWEYSMFANSGTTQNRRNPSFEPIYPTQLFTIGNGGDVMMSFDMYLPENFYCDGEDSTSIMIQVYPKYTGSASSSDYQNIVIDKNGINVPGFPVAQLPIGKWFNIKYILHCDVTNGVKADLYIDNAEIGKNTATSFRLYGGNGTENIRINGITTIRATLVTTNSTKVIDPPYRVYMDNMEIRSMKNMEVLSYAFMNNFESVDTLMEGMNRFEVKLRNLGSQEQRPIVGAALYRDGELCDIEMTDSQLVASGTDADYSLYINVDRLDDAEYELRTFIWDDAATLNSVKTQMTLKE